MSNYWNGMVSIPGFTKQPDGSLYNSKTGERYNADGTVSTTRNNGRDVVQTTDTTHEYSYPEPQRPERETQTNTQPQTPQMIIQTPDTSIQDNIRQLQEARRKSRIAALDTAKNNALATLSNEESTIAPQYYEKRRQATANSDINALNFAQYMAAKGVKGSAGAMPEIYRNVGLQNNLGNLYSQEQTAKDTIARNRSGIENNYQSDVVAANADIDAQGLQEYINQMNADRAFKLQEAGITGNYGGQRTLAGQKYADEQQAQREATYARTIGQFAGDYQDEYNKIANDGDPTNDWQLSYIGAARQEKLQEQAEKKATAAVAAGKAAQQQYENALEAWKLSGVASQAIANIIGVPVGARTADFNIDNINAATNSYEAQTGRINANTNAAKAQNNSSGTSKTEQDNKDFADDYSTLKKMSVNNAVQAMESNWTSIITRYGADGAKKLWNTVLYDAIQAGQAKAR